MDVDIELYRREVRISAQPLIRLSAIDIGPEHPRRTMVFVHGFGGQATQWQYQLHRFSDEARAIALDLRGHGQSDKPRADYSMASLVNDLVLALDVLGVEGKMIMVGHSFGCAILTEYAAAHPDRVERMVLIAGAGEYRLPRLRHAYHVSQRRGGLEWLEPDARPERAGAGHPRQPRPGAGPARLCRGGAGDPQGGRGGCGGQRAYGDARAARGGQPRHRALCQPRRPPRL